MRMWFSILNETKTCTACGQEIPANTLATFSRWGSYKAWQISAWHPECLVEHSRKALVKPTKVKLSRSESEARVRLMKQYAANRQRIATYQERPASQLTELRIHRLLALQQLLKVRMLEVGGLPRRWCRDRVGVAS